MKKKELRKEEIATAGFILKLKKVIARGMATPPPPIPPTFASNMNDANTKVPTHSFGSSGNKSLC